MTKMNEELKGDQELQADSMIAEEMVESELGSRNPTGAFPKKVLFYVPLVWTLFQLWMASPLPYIFNVLVLNDTETRAIHLAFAMFLSYTAFSTFKSSARDYIPLQDWAMALVAA
ncbi:MAG: C4-dicarboxylate ABC transporter, partial [Deltaproteobacteria bacterium]|nr:C4-dicarboxylate ABC transporter [Deltaproteobacteria bacterium]